ncbi:MAG: RagB/SusD family nutrient uptake outer membrane protein [Muribaculaceae bacterium]|nr:RagB/SusD family nutrient uptake outer membrane protein [Muribaculaceae bacterium]
MNNKFKYSIFAAAVAVMGLSSCNDVLDINSTKTFSDQAVWSSPSTADLYVVASYNTLQDYLVVGGGLHDAYADLLKSTNWDARGSRINKVVLRRDGIQKGSVSHVGNWGIYGSRIRRANVCYLDIDRYGKKFGDEWCRIRQTEVRFCNALNYFFLARVYGGVVLRTPWSGSHGMSDGMYEEDIHLKRSTEEETYDFILSELQYAAENLPDEWETKWVGRGTKQMAYAFISRIALYAHKWELAAAAADSVKAMGGALVDNYADLFTNGKLSANRKEVICAVEFTEKDKTHGYDNLMRPAYDGHKTQSQMTAECVPTAELADAFDWKDGSEFSWDNWEKNHTDPYTDREPRFHATILYNGAKWEDRTIETFVGQGSVVPDGTDHFVEYHSTACTYGYTCTGYYMRKYLDEGNANYKADGSYMPELILRYAEVLLNKAEALAMINYSANAQKALDALNEVRARVNLPNRTLTDAPDLESFMELLRKERICELAGENFRYWDLRRWRLAEEVLNGKCMHGTLITMKYDGTFEYEYVDVDDGEKRSFQKRDYYYSLPTDEITNNKLAYDNPDW